MIPASTNLWVEHLKGSACRRHCDAKDRQLLGRRIHRWGRPAFLLGHSAGGVVSSVYALENQAELAGFICESFAFQVPAPSFVLAAVKGLSHLAPRLPALTLKNEDFSRDPKAVEALNNDPLHRARKAAGDHGRGARSRRRTVAGGVSSLSRLPVLIMHGTADKATVCHGSEFFYKTAGSKDKTLKLYGGHYHDLLNDLGKEGVIADITAWIDKRVVV